MRPRPRDAVLTLEEAAEPLGLHFSRIGQLQKMAMDSLAHTVAGEQQRDRPDPEELKAPLIERLRVLGTTAAPLQ